MRLSRVDWRFWLAASLLVHATVMIFGVRQTRPTRPATSTTTRTMISFDLPRSAETPTLARATTVRATSDTSSPLRIEPAQAPVLGGARNAQNVDTDDPGERGDGRSEESGRLLTAHTDPVTLSPHTMNTLAADQEHRLRTARDRASWQDARHTPNPGYDPWISSDHGVLLFRLPHDEHVAARGAMTTPGASTVAGAARVPVAFTGTTSTITATVTPGSVHHVAAGIAAGDASRLARVAGPSAFGRASIEQGHASTTADRMDERPRDQVDAEALATTLIHHAIATSVHSGDARGPGEGGVGGGGAAGSGGGTAEGGRARPHGEGDGWMSLASPDGRYVRYFQLLRRRIDSLWTDAFPRDEALRLQQGTVILAFVLSGNGQVHDVRVQRRSGIDRFDANVLAALRDAHLPPIPAELHRDELHLTVPFVFRNPIVR